MTATYASARLTAIFCFILFFFYIALCETKFFIFIFRLYISHNFFFLSIERQPSATAFTCQIARETVSVCVGCVCVSVCVRGIVVSALNTSTLARTLIVCLPRCVCLWQSSTLLCLSVSLFYLPLSLSLFCLLFSFYVWLSPKAARKLKRQQQRTTINKAHAQQ